MFTSILFVGFVQMMGDSPEVQYSLAPNVSTFLHSHAHLLPPDTHLGFVWRDIPKALRGEAVNGDCTFSAVYVSILKTIGASSKN